MRRSYAFGKVKSTGLATDSAAPYSLARRPNCSSPVLTLMQPPRRRMPTSRQPHGEFGEMADFAVGRDRAAVLQGYDLVGDRQA